MKYWLSHLPLEVWVDCYRYPWISREELGRIVDQFRNHKFAEYLQFYLHDWGKRMLNEFSFEKDGLCKYVFKPFRRNLMDYPLTPLPANIKSFECIGIRHFDQHTIGFLHRIQPLVQADIQLKIYDIVKDNRLKSLRVILTHMVPLMDSTHSLDCEMRALPTVQQCFGNEKLTKINWIQIFDQGYEGFDEAMTQATINFLMTWLTPVQHGDIGTKWCELNSFIDNGFSAQICAAIREEFLAAKSPSTFALFVHPLYSQWEFAEFHLQNSIGEELHGVNLWYKSFQITRHKANYATEMRQWIKGIKAKKSSNSCRQNEIVIESPTIGQIDAMNDPINVDNDQQKPSTSKEEA